MGRDTACPPRPALGLKAGVGEGISPTPTASSAHTQGPAVCPGVAAGRQDCHPGISQDHLTPGVGYEQHRVSQPKAEFFFNVNLFILIGL